MRFSTLIYTMIVPFHVFETTVDGDPVRVLAATHPVTKLKSMQVFEMDEKITAEDVSYIWLNITGTVLAQ
jgi:hypothetical protein